MVADTALWIIFGSVSDTAICLFVNFDLCFLGSNRLGGQLSEQKDAGTLDKVKMPINFFLAKLQIQHFVLWPMIYNI